MASRFPAAEAIDRLCALRVRHVTLHTGRASELRDAAAEAGASSDATRIGCFGEDYLFSVCARVPPGRDPAV